MLISNLSLAKCMVAAETECTFREDCDGLDWSVIALSDDPRELDALVKFALRMLPGSSFEVWGAPSGSFVLLGALQNGS